MTKGSGFNPPRPLLKSGGDGVLGFDFRTGCQCCQVPDLRNNLARLLQTSLLVMYNNALVIKNMLGPRYLSGCGSSAVLLSRVTRSTVLVGKTNPLGKTMRPKLGMDSAVSGAFPKARMLSRLEVHHTAPSLENVRLQLFGP